MVKAPNNCIFIDWKFHGFAYVVIIFVLQFGVYFLCCMCLLSVSINLVMFGGLSGHFYGNSCSNGLQYTLRVSVPDSTWGQLFKINNVVS